MGKFLLYLFCLVFGVADCLAGGPGKVILPAALQTYISSIEYGALGNLTPRISVETISGKSMEAQVTKVTLAFTVPTDLAQDDWQIKIVPAFHPSFHWSPLLTPRQDNIIAQHVFRSPALIAMDSGRQLSVVPDLDQVGRPKGVEWYLDLDAPENVMKLGWSLSAVTLHTQYVRRKGMIVPAGEAVCSFFLITGKPAVDGSPWRATERFMWQRWGHPLHQKGEPSTADPQDYVKRTYHWAFASWRDAVWQEFELNGHKVGAPVFIVNVTQSPDYPGPVSEREFRSVWNQAWFSSLRSASGLYRYARRSHNDSLLKKALLAKELALSFPQHDGLFPSVIGTDMVKVKVGDKELNRSAGWSHYFFGNSNRNPQAPWGAAINSPYHILDMSWTADWMLQWYDELEKDPRLIAYARRYADNLLRWQDADGFFPSWIDSRTLQPLQELKQSPETSETGNFLLRLYSLTHASKYKIAAMRTLDAVRRTILPEGRWEDFETYWSCSWIYSDSLGRKLQRNDQFKQNTLSMFWTADAFLRAFTITGDSSWLWDGRSALDELLMYQACWQPPFIYIHALGGFGVMNADAEWNDARQSLFAELIIKYGKILNEAEYKERGAAALKASFVMMYCPENPETKAQWEKVYPFFTEKDFGFMMENYGHGGVTGADGLGIGEFTIYDWGNGAASEAYERIRDHYGPAGLTGK